MDILCDKKHRYYNKFGKLENKICKKCSSKELTWIVTAKYKEKPYDEYMVEKWAELGEEGIIEDEPDRRGKIKFDPKVFALTSMNNGHRLYWFPYWIKINDDHRRYGQFSPMIYEEEFIQLMKNAFNKGVFSKKVKEEIRDCLNQQNP